jgi:ribosomal protein S14
MSQEGMLVQVDGSIHAWLEERGPRCTVLLAIDDATSTVPYALFRQEEDTHGYFLLMQELIRRCGVPLALYSDRHAVFKYVPGSHQSPAPTQFGRAMAELGVEQIFARSPEAKGRVERANGTFQDRLVTELRLAGARTISEANQVLWAFLSRFNQRFGVPPAQSANAYVSPDPNMDLAGILCFKHRRKVARDNTVKYNWHTLQLLPSTQRSTYVGAHVVVQERLDGKLVVYYQDQIVPAQEAPPRPGALRTLNGTRGLGSVTLESLAAGMGTNGVGGHKREELGAIGVIGRRLAASSLTTDRENEAGHHKVQGPRQPTPRQRARWKAVQRAKRRGLSLRAIARELGISRITVRRYVAASSPPVYPDRVLAAHS